MKNRLFFWMFLLLSVTLTGCLKDDPNEGTIILMGTESDVMCLDSIHELDSLVRFLRVKGVDLPTGNTPPDVQGEFLFPRAWLYVNYNPDDTVAVKVNDTLFFRFGGEYQEDSTWTYPFYEYGQHNRILPYDYWEPLIPFDNVTDMVYVMGHDSLFTVYFVQECKNMSMDAAGSVTFDMRRGGIITGTISRNNEIIDGKVAFQNLDLYNVSNPAVVGLNESMKGRINVFKIKNGRRAVRKQWYPDPYAD